MVRNLTLLLNIALISIKAQAEKNQEFDWQIQPQACIVQTLGELCEIELDIVLPELAEGEYCYFQNERMLVCFDQQNIIDSLSISFREDTLFALKNATQKLLFSQTLRIKTRETSKRIRRVREPWSFF